MQFVSTDVAIQRGVNGDLFLADAGQGVGFRAGTFDGVIRFASTIKPILFS